MKCLRALHPYYLRTTREELQLSTFLTFEKNEILYLNTSVVFNVKHF